MTKKNILSGFLAILCFLASNVLANAQEKTLAAQAAIEEVAVFQKYTKTLALPERDRRAAFS
ncbi:MAG TPA: hypothetical protein VF648_00770 [Pyrinomonadaceae bacterium]|jgi:hypothetical protein